MQPPSPWTRRRVASGGQPRAGFGCDPVVAVPARCWYPLEAEGRKVTVVLAFAHRPVVWLTQEQRTGVAVAAWARASPRTYPIDQLGGLGLDRVVSGALARGPGHRKPLGLA